MSPHVHLPVPPSSLRHVAALALRSASAVLERMAHRLAAPPPSPEKARWPQVEFHAEAGALEGALYVDGQLVARLPGVSRL